MKLFNFHELGQKTMQHITKTCRGDDSFVFFSIGMKPNYRCKSYQTCEVIIPPFTEGKFMGGRGWLFPKRSPFLPAFNQLFWKIKELGLYQRIINQPKYSPNKLLPKQYCETLDGDPISMHKVVSLFALFAVAFNVTLVIFGYVK